MILVTGNPMKPEIAIKQKTGNHLKPETGKWMKQFYKFNLTKV
jgi:hypothetical protein